MRAHAHINSTTLLTPNVSPPKMICHSTAWLTGGKSSARIDDQRFAGLHTREGEVRAHVARLPEEETEVGHEDGDGKRREVDPRRVAHRQDHGGDETSSAPKKPPNAVAIERGRRDAGGPGSETADEQEVGDDDGHGQERGPRSGEPPSSSAATTITGAAGMARFTMSLASSVSTLTAVISRSHLLRP